MISFAFGALIFLLLSDEHVLGGNSVWVDLEPRLMENVNSYGSVRDVVGSILQDFDAFIRMNLMTVSVVKAALRQRIRPKVAVGTG
ncbi:unnamed protein product [Calicophoron daubneyi]|uniref:Uncharacterized protein n=1 Tax=Calicophoron daubneyi TaxID=300641 RepID=A0AAV2U2U4_CALDB